MLAGSDEVTWSSHSRRLEEFSGEPGLSSAPPLADRA